MTTPSTTHQDPSVELYEQDYYRWLEQTAIHLRQQAFDQLDLEDLIAEIEAMGRSERRGIESNLRVILTHLLKWKYQPQQRSGSWGGSIAEHRIRVRKSLQDSPSLKNYLLEIFGSSGFSMIALHAIHFQRYAAPINSTTKLRRSCG